MNISLRMVILFCLSIFSFPAAASYLVVVPALNSDFLAAPELYKDTRVHIIVSGRGGTLGDQFIDASLVKGATTRKIFPDELVVMYLADTPEAGDDRLRPPYPANSQHPDHISVLGQDFITKRDPAFLDRKLLMSKLIIFNKIASLEFYTHSAIQPGMFLDRSGASGTRSAWRPFDKDIGDAIPTARLTGHFTEDAYAFIYGCNGAHLLAPWLAEQWNIPVAGSFTSAYIQRATIVSGPSGPYKLYNYDYKDGVSGTARMKSDKIAYAEMYGPYPVIFPAFRFFCLNSDSTKCSRGIGKSILTTVSAVAHGDLTDAAQRKEFFYSVIREWLCPTDSKGDGGIFKSCIDALTKATRYIESGQEPPDFLKNYMPVGEGEPSLDCNAFASRCYDPICYKNRTYRSWEYKTDSDPTGESTTTDMFVSTGCARDGKVSLNGAILTGVVPSVRVTVNGDGDRQGAASFMAEYAKLMRSFDAVQAEIPATFWTS